MTPKFQNSLFKLITLVGLGIALSLSSSVKAIDLPEEVEAAEQHRIEAVSRLTQSTIAIFESTGQSGGSGVLIDPSGYALTNFHVTAPCGPLMTVGTSDGEVHQAVIVGIDPSGDIALIKLLGAEPYIAAEIGDSDLVEVGDEAIVAGNPFLLADDFSPTITFGIISGTHRYQPPSGTLLEYTDCLQTDASINPGNSGGPLFDIEGRLIGINGRGSFEKRGRVNVGVGYAVSINQVLRFLPHLKSGRIVDHASLGATVRTARGFDQEGSQATSSRAVIDALLTGTDAYRRGLRPGDELLLFNDQEVHTANQILNAVGVCPPGWRIPILYRRQSSRQGVSSAESELREVIVQLEPLHNPSGLREGVASMTPEQKLPAIPKAKQDNEWKAFYEKEEGYANRFFNRQEVSRVLTQYRQTQPILFDGSQLLLDTETDQKVKFAISDSGVKWESTVARFRLDSARPFDEQPVPTKTPGLLAGLWITHQIDKKQESKLDELFYLGQLNWIPNEEPQDVIRVQHRGAQIDYYFTSKQSELTGFEIKLDDIADTVRVEFLSGDNSSASVSTMPGARRLQIRMSDESHGNYLLQKEMP